MCFGPSRSFCCCGWLADCLCFFIEGIPLEGFLMPRNKIQGRTKQNIHFPTFGAACMHTKQKKREKKKKWLFGVYEVGLCFVVLCLSSVVLCCVIFMVCCCNFVSTCFVVLTTVLFLQHYCHTALVFRASFSSLYYVPKKWQCLLHAH